MCNPRNEYCNLRENIKKKNEEEWGGSRYWRFDGFSTYQLHCPVWHPFHQQHAWPHSSQPRDEAACMLSSRPSCIQLRASIVGSVLFFLKEIKRRERKINNLFRAINSWSSLIVSSLFSLLYLPEPVSPTMTNTWCSSTAFKIDSR